MKQRDTELSRPGIPDMETLSPDTADMYLSLGLREQGKKILGCPRVLMLLSSALDRSVQKNERLLETSHSKDVITIFHGVRPPALTIRQYIERIFKYSACSPSCFVIAQIYMDRFVQNTDVLLTSLNVHRLLITSLTVAAKFVDDAFFNNAYYAKVGGVSTSELNRLEMKFLFNIDFRLHVSIDTFQRYCLLLEKEVSEGLQIERSIQSCRITESWSNKEDSTWYSHSC
ncbi:cyclin-P3-1 isoform X2 [Eucalyptus grandis]|uniref:cyclin-P3-1 isoform X2 n=1 Tax=Eucalyptus grandis TaxID=71139 RepID=UPI00192E9E31|nr:cyclin-P3-1 isoform X2 [Eucalyptus grandis]